MSTKNTTNNNENTTEESIKISQDVDEEKKLWGYDLYPERRGTDFKPNFFKAMIGMEGKENIHRTRCEANVYKVYRSSKYVSVVAFKLYNSLYSIVFVNFLKVPAQYIPHYKQSAISLFVYLFSFID